MFDEGLSRTIIYMLSLGPLPLGERGSIVRAAENNNYPNIALDFYSDSRRGKWRILEYATLAVTQKLSNKDKQGWIIIVALMSSG